MMAMNFMGAMCIHAALIVTSCTPAIYTAAASAGGGEEEDNAALFALVAAPVKGNGSGDPPSRGVLPPKTGQTVSYAAMDDGALRFGAARTYTDNGNGTVTDNATGLTWQKCSRGQNNDATCSGGATTTYWNNAHGYCSALSLASRIWRLPTVQELEFLPDYGRSSPAIDTTYFQNAIAALYWSSTIYAPNTISAWTISLGSGSVDGGFNTTSYRYVRCVSGSSTPTASFADNGNGTVTDTATGLIWQKCSVGQTGANCSGGSDTSMDWPTALITCSGLNLASKTWRLPNINELKTLVDTTKSTSPLIYDAFPDTPGSYYWSSTTAESSHSDAWGVFFGGGNVDYYLKTSTNSVRCVSGP